MNILEWMQAVGYIKKKVAAIYFSNFDATLKQKFKLAREKF